MDGKRLVVAGVVTCVLCAGFVLMSWTGGYTRPSTAMHVHSIAVLFALAGIPIGAIMAIAGALMRDLKR